MFGWLKHKGDNARIHMCIKELKYHLEASNHERIAVILAMATLVRVVGMEENGFPRIIFDRPDVLPRDALLETYDSMDSTRIANVRKLDGAMQLARRANARLSDVVIQQSRLSDRALEVWMCTIGGAIIPERMEDVREIWRLLKSAIPHLPEACSTLYQWNSQFAFPIGPRSTIAEIDGDAWMEECGFIPSAYF